jgi:ABC-type branched-subunit amino acid transport system substrate-binding protein
MPGWSEITARRRAGLIVAGAAVAAVSGCGSSGTSSSGSPSASSAPITVAELFPITGPHAAAGQWFVDGATVGIDEVNAAGGVMGRPLVAQVGDTAGDPVDTTTAWHQLELSNPAFELGPAAPDFDGVAKLYDPAHLTDWTEVGLDTYDHMTFKYVWRSTPSDSTQSVSMAYYAISDAHCTSASFLFTNASNKAGEVAPLQAAFQKHGGTVLDTELLAPNESSYRTELVKAFATKPGCVFIGLDEPTAATVFSDIKQLGDLNVPFIGDEGAAAADFAAATVGTGATASNLTVVAGSSPSGPAWEHYVAGYQNQWHTNQPTALSPNMYDAVIVSALAMTYAKSTNPSVWNFDITKVTNGPGQQCVGYAACLNLLKAGKKIQYEAATGSFVFNQYHNIFGDWAIGQWQPGGTLTDVATVTAAEISNFA